MLATNAKKNIYLNNISGLLNPEIFFNYALNTTCFNIDVIYESPLAQIQNAIKRLNSQASSIKMVHYIVYSERLWTFCFKIWYCINRKKVHNW
jgi:hypothetical protein